jgi:hypothetical protein
MDLPSGEKVLGQGSTWKTQMATELQLWFSFQCLAGYMYIEVETHHISKRPKPAWSLSDRCPQLFKDISNAFDIERKLSINKYANTNMIS